VGLCLPLLLGCQRAEPIPQPPARVNLQFLDRVVVVGLPACGEPGPWEFMDAGIWRPLAVTWVAPGRLGQAEIPRTAPAWVVVRDPARRVHQVPPCGTTPPRGDEADPEAREWLTLVGLAWVLSWVKR
jgi:hypothetical protein